MNLIKEHGWLIEKNILGSPLNYWTGTWFSTKAEEGLRFARKKDAEHYVRISKEPSFRGLRLTISEHIWETISHSPQSALAEAWASIDGKDDAFRAGFAAREKRVPAIDAIDLYEAYMSEAQNMIERLQKRGFKVVPL